MNAERDDFLPIVRPCPPTLSSHARELAHIEESGVFSNYGPVNTTLEREFIESMFGCGESLTVCNATIGLMLAIQAVLEEQPRGEERFALMPSFTFAAAAHAAKWCGLTPLFCDVNPHTWLPEQSSEEQLLHEYAGRIALLLPCATFGNNLDLERYASLSRTHGIPVVVDAAASLGSIDQRGRPFGSGFAWPVVFSMNATKLFSVGEGGLIYCSDTELLKRLRIMGCFGFDQPRSAGFLGLNAKMSEVTALTALLELRRLKAVMETKEQIASWYSEALAGDYETQHRCGKRQAQAFMSILLPPDVSSDRTRVSERMRTARVGTAAYFSPHLAEQPFFRQCAPRTDLRATGQISSQVLNLPMLERMSKDDVEKVTTALRMAVQQTRAEVDIRSTSFPAVSSA